MHVNALRKSTVLVKENSHVSANLTSTLHAVVRSQFLTFLFTEYIHKTVHVVYSKNTSSLFVFLVSVSYMP